MSIIEKFQKLGSSLRGPGDDILDDNDTEYDDDERYDLEEDTYEEEPKRTVKQEPAPRVTETITQRQTMNRTNTSGINLAIRRPTEFSAVGEIANDVLEGQTVALNLENTSKGTAIRIFDFLSGVAYSVKAKIEPVADNTYVIIPSGTNITAQEVSDEETAEAVPEDEE